MNPTNSTRSTQILTQKIQLDNKLDPHISIKDQISNRFKNTNVYAVSVDYDNTVESKKNHDVWLTISQGVSRHINYNAEKFRKRFVRHEGKKEIIIGVDDILSANMVKAYFKNICCFECGIPKITLEGTLEDWMKLQEKVNQLRKLNLELDFWLDRLEPVIWNLVATYRGEINEDFWSRIVKIGKNFGSGGGGTYITGWMISFFPYDSAGELLKSYYLELDYIPNGIVGVPFETNIGNKLKFVAGFIGANQEILENSDGESVVSPVIGWTVVDDTSSDEPNFEF
ncbi:hypothetical protein C2G38_2206107 [Gigaspora rosea]|uniref:DUF4419 domain-containing protein n=1 Tax=Gigaspora rosea TaxID=44941 RepID=A0A397UP07_9GLOM|nr:hypothetical protein C2G38_2206107 [Gigaspora rosea]